MADDKVNTSDLICFVLGAPEQGICQQSWFDSKDAMLSAIRDIPSDFPFLFGDESELDLVQVAISSLIDGHPYLANDYQALSQEMNKWLDDSGSWGVVEFIGTFDELCEGNTEWATQLRLRYRDFEDDEDMSKEEAAKPISPDEKSSFQYFVESITTY